MDLTGKVAWVTGGTSGIGEATAIRLAKAGAKVAVLGRSRDELAQAVGEVEQAGSEALALKCDLQNPEEIGPVVDQIIDAWGRLDIVVANAGINGTWAPLTDLTVEDWNTTQEINLRGTFLTLKHAIPHLRRRGGSVVIVSSVNGTRIFSNTGATAYACSKAAQVALAKMAALELARDRIRVNVVCPGAIETSIDESTETKNLESVGVKVEYPEGRIPLTGGEPGTSAQVAELIAFLASDLASHISGTEVWIDGAESLLQG